MNCSVSEMRTIFIISTLLTFVCEAAENAYMLVDAIYIPQTSKQPTWIAFKKGTLMVHVPTKETIVSVEPGIYSLNHIDRTTSKLFERAKIPANYPNEYTFEARVDSITYIGLIQVEDAGSRLNQKTQRISILASKIILEWACEKNPEIFSTLPVRIIENDNVDKQIRVNCKT